MKCIYKRLYKTRWRRNAVVKGVWRIVKRRVEKGYVDVNGYRLFLNKNISSELAVLGLHEPEETEIVKKAVKPGDTVLDIGANVGYYTLLFSQLVGEKGKVIAVEPEPTTFSILKKNVEYNKATNVLLLNNAAFDKETDITLYIDDKHQSSHTLADTGKRPHIVKALRMDDVIDSADFIKVDVEGFEPAVFRGMSRILEKGAFVIFEDHKEHLARAGFSELESRAILKELGYHLQEVGHADWTLNERHNVIASKNIQELHDFGPLAPLPDFPNGIFYETAD